MFTILIPHHPDIELPSADLIRPGSGDKPDQQDVNDYFANLKATVRGAPAGFVARDPSAIVDPSGVAASSSAFNGPRIPYTRPNAVNQDAQRHGAYNGDRRCPTTPRDGGEDYPCPPSEKHCDVVPLPFNTLPDTVNFPLIGGVIGVLANSALFEVKSGRVTAYQPRFLYFVALDQANGFAEVPSMLNRAEVNRNPQLIGGSDDEAAFVSSVFDEVGAYPVDDWRPFTNTNPRTLNLGFASFTGPGTSLQYFGMFWGRTYDDESAAQTDYANSYHPLKNGG